MLENQGLEKSLTVDRLTVEIYRERKLMGQAVASAVAEKMKELLTQKTNLNMIFAAAPSQNEFLKALGNIPGIDWPRVNAFHMDEYLGLTSEAPQRFGVFLRERLFNRVKPGNVYYLVNDDPNLTGKPSPAIQAEAIKTECVRYTRLLRDNPVDIVCMGIGENGHIAFNDPPLADFNDPNLLKPVQLDERSRIQQVHDGCFASLDEVPTHALTLTIPALTAAKYIYCIVPSLHKREAVHRTLRGPITPDCPATILRNHSQARLYLDHDSAGDL